MRCKRRSRSGRTILILNLHLDAAKKCEDALELLKEDKKRIADYQRWHENQKNTIKELLNAQKQIVPQERNGNYFCYCGNRLHKIVETDKFCSRCGRAVKWDG